MLFLQILQRILHSSLLDKQKTLFLNFFWKAGLNIFLSDEKEKGGVTKKEGMQHKNIQDILLNVLN